MAGAEGHPVAATVEHSPGAGRARHLRLLAVVDGTERTNRMVDFIVTLCGSKTVAEVVLFNVQTKRTDARLRGYQTFKQDEVDDRLLSEFAVPIVNSVSKRLAGAGITCASRVAVGDPVSEVLRCATENGCDIILVGARAGRRSRRVVPNLLRMWRDSRLALELVAVAPGSVVVVR